MLKQQIQNGESKKLELKEKLPSNEAMIVELQRQRFNKTFDEEENFEFYLDSLCNPPQKLYYLKQNNSDKINQEKRGYFYFAFNPVGKVKINYALLNQARVISVKRLNNKFGKISVDDYKQLKDKFFKLYG